MSSSLFCLGSQIWPAMMSWLSHHRTSTPNCQCDVTSHHPPRSPSGHSNVKWALACHTWVWKEYSWSSGFLQTAHELAFFSFCMFSFLFCTGVINQKVVGYISCNALCIPLTQHSTYINSYSASRGNWCTATLWNRVITAQCEGMGEVGSARYEPALLPPCPSIRALCYSNCQRSTQSHQQSKG